MLPRILRGNGQTFKPGKLWNQYLDSIGELASRLDHDFLSSICYEHFDRFNSMFPKFDLDRHLVIREKFTTKWIYDNVRYDNNQKLDFHSHMIDDYLHGHNKYNYFVLQDCVNNGTWPFCPVIIEHDFGLSLGGKNLGSPLHLIEGTHRVCFINRLYELGMVKENKFHEVLVIKPKL